MIDIQLPSAYRELLEPYRYKIYYGGRGAARSWSFARALVGCGYERPLRIACLREYMSNIKESVHQVLKGQIHRLGMDTQYRVHDQSITSAIGSEFIFKGIVQDPVGVKSMEGIDIAWVEEGQALTKSSLEILRPTIRKPGSEIWVSMNTGEEDDPVYDQLIRHPPGNAVVKLVTFEDNPWFKDTELEAERLECQARDEDDYNHIWLGMPKKISEAMVFRRRIVVEDFLTPGEDFGEPWQLPVLRFGLDFGFAADPAAFVRFWITGEPPNEELWVDYEVYAWHTEIDDLPDAMRRIPKAGEGWAIRADAARPESISYLARHGFGNIAAAEKWNGSVEDGIAHLKAYKKIHIHKTRCPHLTREARHYSYKVDKKTGLVLPVLVDKWNHGIDALRYGHDGIIQRRGILGQWARLGRG